MRKTTIRVVLNGPDLGVYSTYRAAKSAARHYATRHNTKVMLMDAESGKLLKTVVPEGDGQEF